MRAHLTEDVKKKVNEENIIPVIIPDGFSKILQPLDISVNKSFKTNLRQIWESWMTTGEHSFTKTGRLRHATLTNVVEWVHQAWKDVTPICIINGFRKQQLELHFRLALNATILKMKLKMTYQVRLLSFLFLTRRIISLKAFRMMTALRS